MTSKRGLEKKMTSTIKNSYFTTPSCYSWSSKKHSATADANEWLTNSWSSKLLSVCSVSMPLIKLVKKKNPEWQAIWPFIRRQKGIFPAVVWPLPSLCDHLGFGACFTEAVVCTGNTPMGKSELVSVKNCRWLPYSFSAASTPLF